MLADGLLTSAVAPATFQELGEPESAVQVPQIALLEYEKYSVLIQVAERRATITEKSGISATSPIPTMMSRIVSATEGIKISAIGFNFSFDCVTDGPSVEIMRQYVQLDRLSPLGSVRSAGFKVAATSNDKLVQLNVDPVWGQDAALLTTLNYHFQTPKDTERVLNSYREMAIEAGDIVKRVFDVA